MNTSPMILKGKSDQTQSCFQETLVTKSELNVDKIYEAIIESSSDLTEEDIVRIIFTILRYKKSRLICHKELAAFFMNKSKEESDHAYIEYYFVMLHLSMCCLNQLFDLFAQTGCYCGNMLAYNHILLLPSSDLILSKTNAKQTVLCPD